jgi:hypothetical protein
MYNIVIKILPRCDFCYSRCLLFAYKIHSIKEHLEFKFSANAFSLLYYAVLCMTLHSVSLSHLYILWLTHNNHSKKNLYPISFRCENPGNDWYLEARRERLRETHNSFIVDTLIFCLFASAGNGKG